MRIGRLETKVGERRAAVAAVGTLLAAMAMMGCAGGETTRNGTGGAKATGSGGAGGGSGNPGGGSSGQASLPMAVTDFFNNQGWFGDANIAAYFMPGSTVIRQGEVSTGPCAARVAGARGKCLEIVYTPPAGLTPPAGSGTYVGVFMLTTLTAAHPELSPPANIGDANWGAEPGKNIAPGATKISFQAATATAGLTVTFKAGTSADLFALAEQPETLSTS